MFDAVSQLHIDAIFCDAVEFYNPVHDIALPIVSGQLPNVPVFEIPLIQEDAAIGVQMLATPPGVREETTLLTAAQVEKKLRFLSTIYSSLSRYLSVSLATDDLRYADHEAFFEARANPVLPAPGAEIRYDLRGRILVERGIYGEAITFAGHYLPTGRSAKMNPNKT